MDALLITSIITTLQAVAAIVPPDACFQDFRWEDCGQQPRAVMYYWKPGSRCEVGIWRGCRPSLNMFKDEYECVSTCIFTVRASASDFHNLQVVEEEPVTQSEESDYESWYYDGWSEEGLNDGGAENATVDGLNSASPGDNVTESSSGNADETQTGGSDLTKDGVTDTAEPAAEADDAATTEGGDAVEATETTLD